MNFEHCSATVTVSKYFELGNCLDLTSFLSCSGSRRAFWLAQSLVVSLFLWLYNLFHRTARQSSYLLGETSRKNTPELSGMLPVVTVVWLRLSAGLFGRRSMNRKESTSMLATGFFWALSSGGDAA